MKIFFDIVRLGMWGNNGEPPCVSLSRDDWKRLFALAHSQSVTGLFVDGVACLATKPDNDIWDRWIAHLCYMERANRYIAARGDRWLKLLAEEGMQAAVFKGASVAAWYRNPLHRSFGDIDIVVTDGWERLNAAIAKCDALMQRSDEGEIVLQEENNLFIEIHDRWEYLYNPLTNARLQKLCNDGMTNEMYFVALVLHIQRHFLTYGIGLKQIYDIAAMLHNATLDHKKVAWLLRHLHARKFSRLLFGFVESHIGAVGSYPLEPIAQGGSFDLFEKVILHEGYNLKMEQELRAGQRSKQIARIAHNARFWAKRCFRLAGIVPGEACCFLCHKIYKRLTFAL